MPEAILLSSDGLGGIGLRGIKYANEQTCDGYASNASIPRWLLLNFFAKNLFEFCPEQVYQPEEDSWLLTQAAKNEITASDKILEIGVGSGVVSERGRPVI